MYYAVQCPECMWYSFWEDQKKAIRSLSHVWKEPVRLGTHRGDALVLGYGVFVHPCKQLRDTNAKRSGSEETPPLVL